MDEPANTLSYFAAGYAVIFGLTLLYIASLVARWKSLKKDEELLKELKEK